MLITFTKGFPWITSSLCQQLIEFCLVYINRKIFNWLLVIPKLCTGASGITIKYSFSQLLDWVAAASSVDKEIYEYVTSNPVSYGYNASLGNNAIKFYMRLTYFSV